MGALTRSSVGPCDSAPRNKLKEVLAVIRHPHNDMRSVVTCSEGPRE